MKYCLNEQQLILAGLRLLEGKLGDKLWECCENKNTHWLSKKIVTDNYNKVRQIIKTMEENDG